MNSVSRRACAGIAVFALAAIGVLGVAASASAASAVIDTISTPENQLRDQYGSDLSPDGTLFALPSYTQNTVTLVNTTTHTQTLVADTGSVFDSPNDVAFSPDGSRLYVADFGGSIVAVVDVASATVIDEIRYDGYGATALEVSPDGSTLLVADNWGSVYAFDLSSVSYDELWSVDESLNSVLGIYFSADSAAALLVDSYANTQTVDLASHTISELVEAEDQAGGYGVCMSPDNSAFAISDGNSTVFLVDSVTGATRASLDLGGDGASSLMGCTFTSAGQLVFTDWSYQGASDEGHVFVLDGSTLDLLETISTPNVAYTNSVAVTADCTAFASGEYTNISVIALDSSYCVPVASTDSGSTATPAGAALASTGVDASAIGANAVGAVALLGLGGVSVLAVRRRRTV